MKRKLSKSWNQKWSLLPCDETLFQWRLSESQKHLHLSLMSWSVLPHGSHLSWDRGEPCSVGTMLRRKALKIKTLKKQNLKSSLECEWCFKYHSEFVLNTYFHFSCIRTSIHEVQQTEVKKCNRFFQSCLKTSQSVSDSFRFLLFMSLC